MKNDREMMQALLDGETLVTNIGLEWKLGDDKNIKTPIGYGKYPFYGHVEIKPKTININGFDVPEPLRKVPQKGTSGFVASTACTGSPVQMSWVGNDIDGVWLKNGILHLTAEAAQKHIDALLSFTRK